jgi:hypothetical protein
MIIKQLNEMFFCMHIFIRHKGTQNPSSCLTQCQTEKKRFRQLCTRGTIRCLWHEEYRMHDLVWRKCSSFSLYSQMKSWRVHCTPAHLSFCFEETLYRAFHRCFLPISINLVNWYYRRLKKKKIKKPITNKKVRNSRRIDRLFMGYLWLIKT